jgi:predicted ATPase
MTLYLPDLQQLTRPGYLGGGEWALTGLRDITVVLGRNGVGKSLLLRAIKDQEPVSRHYIPPERAGNISFNIETARRQMDPVQRNTRSQNFASDFRQEAVSRLFTLVIRRGLADQDTPPPIRAEIERLMSRLVPDFGFRIGDDGQLKLHRTGGNAVDQVEHLSSGEAQLLSVGLDMLTMAALWKMENRENRLLLVDEPDLHLHPELQQLLADFLVMLVEAYAVQIIVATHSTTLLAALGRASRNIGVVFMAPSRATLQAVSFDKELADLATCLGGHALMGPLFSFPLLLVEGDDDYRVWSQAVRGMAGPSVAVIPCNGDQIQRYGQKLEAILAALIERTTRPSAYLLRDRDNKGDNTDGRHVARLRLACREVENLYLADEVLSAMGLTWPEACSKIERFADPDAARKLELASLVQCDRGTVRLKPLITILNQILDPDADWRSRIGQVLGKVAPSGRLAEFLGASVVNAFWGTRTEDS